MAISIEEQVCGLCKNYGPTGAALDIDCDMKHSENEIDISTYTCDKWVYRMD